MGRLSANAAPVHSCYVVDHMTQHQNLSSLHRNVIPYLDTGQESKESEKAEIHLHHGSMTIN